VHPSSLTVRRAVAARLAYLVVILIATLADLHFDPSSAEVHVRLARALHPQLALHDLVDGARNVLIFAGLGAVWIATSRSGRPWRSVVAVTLVSLAASTGVESLQLFSAVRESSLLDVTTNTFGGLLGALATVAALDIVEARQGKRSYVGIPAIIFALSYGVAVCMESFYPLLRQDLLPNLGGSPFQRIARGVAAMRTSSVGVIPLTDLLLFLPAGFLAAAALAEAGMSLGAAGLVAALAGVILFPALEVVHGVVEQPVLIGAALTHVVAVAAGALLAARILPSFSRRFHGRERPALLAVAYAVTVMFWSWRPFRLQVDAPSMAEQFSAIHLVPLMALSARFDLFTVTDIIAQFLLFLPLGALLAVWPVRRTGWLRGMWPVVYLSVVLEFGKIVVAERFLDVTHVLIQCAGAGIGWALIRRAGFGQYGEMLPAPTLTSPASPADARAENARGRPDWGGLRRMMRRIVRQRSAR